MKPLVYIALLVLIGFLYMAEKNYRAKAALTTVPVAKYSNEQVEKTNPAFIYFVACSRSGEHHGKWADHDYAYKRAAIVGVSEPAEFQDVDDGCVFVYALTKRTLVRGSFLEVLERLK